jgi:hypothetical protein
MRRSIDPFRRAKGVRRSKVKGQRAKGKGEVPRSKVKGKGERSRLRA